VMNATMSSMSPLHFAALDRNLICVRAAIAHHDPIPNPLGSIPDRGPMARLLQPSPRFFRRYFAASALTFWHPSPCASGTPTVAAEWTAHDTPDASHPARQGQPVKIRIMRSRKSVEHAGVADWSSPAAENVPRVSIETCSNAQG
jgi:hypothetical protein